MHYFPLSLFRPKDRRNPHGNRGDIIPPLNTPTLWSILRLASVCPSIRTPMSATLPTIPAPHRSIPAASPTSPVASVPALVLSYVVLLSLAPMLSMPRLLSDAPQGGQPLASPCPVHGRSVQLGSRYRTVHRPALC